MLQTFNKQIKNVFYLEIDKLYKMKKKRNDENEKL